jgi:MFS family permease
MAFTNFALFGGAFLTPVIVGKMTYEMSWRWPFYFVAIFSGALFPAVGVSSRTYVQTTKQTDRRDVQVFFCVPETAYRRSVDTDMASTDNLLLPTEPTPQNSVELPAAPHAVDPKPEATSSDKPAARTPFLQSLLPFNGRKTSESLPKLLLRPLPLLFHPAILWGMLTQGALIGWTVLIGVVLGVVFQPVFFSEVKVGYMYTGAFIGALLGFVASGLLSDLSAKYLAKLNDGIYEPEFRLLLVIPQTIFGCIGLFGFGHVTGDVHRYGPYWASFFFGLEVMGMVLGATASALYLVDAHRDLAVESFTCLLLFKNFFSFALTWKAVHWVQQNGTWKIFWILGVVQICVGLLSIPMCMSPPPTPRCEAMLMMMMRADVFGKRNRSFFHRHDILKMLGLR